MADEPTIHIVDDDAAVLTMLGTLIRTVYSRVQTYASAKEFLELYPPGGGAGCLLLDVRMPFMNGLELQEELRKRAFDLPIIFLSGHGDIQMAVQTIKKGAYDFIEKPYENRHLLDRIQSALTDSESEKDKGDEPEEIGARQKTLTPREREVLELVIEGETNKGIARALEISDKTVEVFRANMMRKMKAKSLASLVRMTMQTRSR